MPVSGEGNEPNPRPTDGLDGWTCQSTGTMLRTRVDLKTGQSCYRLDGPARCFMLLERRYAGGLGPMVAEQ